MELNMDSKATIKTYLDFESYEQNAILHYLRTMADEGWILKKVDTSFTFEKGSGEKVFYSINYYNPSSGSIEDFLKNYSEKGYAPLGEYSSNYIFSSSEINEEINDINRETNYKVLLKNIAFKILLFLITIPAILLFDFNQGAGEIWYSNSILILLSFALLAGSKEILDFI